MGTISYEEVLVNNYCRHFVSQVQEHAILPKSNMGHFIEVRGHGCEACSVHMEDCDGSSWHTNWGQFQCLLWHHHKCVQHEVFQHVTNCTWSSSIREGDTSCILWRPICFRWRRDKGSRVEGLATYLVWRECMCWSSRWRNWVRCQWWLLTRQRLLFRTMCVLRCDGFCHA